MSQIRTGQITPSSEAWTAWTPTITAATGSFTATSASARYIQIGKTVHFKCDITITTVGTGTGLLFTLPVNAASTIGTVCYGREDALNGAMCMGKLNSVNNQVTVFKYDNTNIAASGSGSIIRLIGTYEAA